MIRNDNTCSIIIDGRRYWIKNIGDSKFDDLESDFITPYLYFPRHVWFDLAAPRQAKWIMFHLVCTSLETVIIYVCSRIINLNGTWKRRQTDHGAYSFIHSDFRLTQCEPTNRPVNLRSLCGTDESVTTLSPVPFSNLELSSPTYAQSIEIKQPSTSCPVSKYCHQIRDKVNNMEIVS